jgi:hypothetical protein
MFPLVSYPSASALGRSCLGGLSHRRHLSVRFLSSHRPSPRKEKAIVALERKLLVIIYHILLSKKPYSDFGADYFDHLQKPRLEQLGYTVTLIPKEATLTHLHNSHQLARIKLRRGSSASSSSLSWALYHPDLEFSEELRYVVSGPHGRGQLQ